MPTAKRILKSIRIDPTVWRDLKLFAVRRDEDIPEAIHYLLKLAKSKGGNNGKSKK